MTFYAARKEMWWISGIFGFMASLTRSQGVIVFAAVLYMYASSIRFNVKKLDRRIIAILLIPIGLVVFFLYTYTITGSFMTFFEAQKEAAYQRTLFGNPVSTIIMGVSDMIMSKYTLLTAYHAYNLAMVGIFLVVLALSYRTIRREYFIYFLLSLLYPLSASQMFAITRYELVIFPAFMTLSIMAGRRRRNALIIYSLYAIFAALLLMFTVWHTVGGLKVESFVL